MKKNWDKKQYEFAFIIDNILEMRFGDGVGGNPQVKIARKELFAEIKKLLHEYGEWLGDKTEELYEREISVSTRILPEEMIQQQRKLNKEIKS